jgi:hypothetical protein
MTVPVCRKMLCGTGRKPEESVADELDQQIDSLFGMLPDQFIPERDALAKQLRAAGDREAADRVKGLRKPTVPAWALNQLARQDPRGVTDVVELGARLRDAQRRAISGGDAGPLREASEARRALVARLGRVAAEILQGTGTASAPHEEEITSTLEAAAADELAGERLRAGRLERPLRPPSSFGEGGLRVVEGGRRSKAAEATEERERADARAHERAEEARTVERELRAAQSTARRTGESVERTRTRYDDLDRRRTEAREALRDAEAAHRGAELERKRLERRLEKLKPSE